jgi:hypothetical protein
MILWTNYATFSNFSVIFGYLKLLLSFWPLPHPVWPKGAIPRLTHTDLFVLIKHAFTTALKHNLIIFLICHTGKTKQDLGTELGLGDIRDSSLIEQESDTVLYIWRDLEAENRSILKIAKNRKRGIINKKIRLIYQQGRLYEEADSGKN